MSWKVLETVLSHLKHTLFGRHVLDCVTTIEICVFVGKLIHLSCIPTNKSAKSRTQGGQKYGKCMKMPTPTSLWCYYLYALK